MCVGYMRLVLSGALYQTLGEIPITFCDIDNNYMVLIKCIKKVDVSMKYNKFTYHWLTCAGVILI
jgi:hypothetical protein